MMTWRVITQIELGQRDCLTDNVVAQSHFSNQDAKLPPRRSSTKPMVMYIKFLVNGLNNMVILFSFCCLNRGYLNLLFHVCSNPCEVDMSYHSSPQLFVPRMNI